MCQKQECIAGEYAFHPQTKQMILIEQAKPKTVYYCAKCGGELYVADGYRLKKHFKHNKETNQENLKQIDTMMKVAKEGFKQVGDTFKIPVYNGAISFKKAKEDGRSLMISKVEYDVKVLAKSKSGKYYNPTDAVMDVMITTEDGRKWGFEFRREGESIHPERVLKYRKDVRVSGVYSVSYQRETGLWEVERIIWRRDKDKESLNEYRLALQEKLTKRDQVINKRKEVKEEKTYYYDAKTTTYRYLSWYPDLYRFNLKIDEEEIELCCRYATFQANQEWLREKGMILMSKQLQAAYNLHQKMCNEKAS